MKIIDMHAHIYPQAISERAVHSVSDFYGLEIRRGGTVEALLERGKQAGINSFVVHSVATAPQQVRTINEFIAGEAAAHPELTGFGTLHPDMIHPEQEIDKIEALGLKGVKLHPDTQKFNMDDPKMMRIYEMLEGRLPVLMHCGDYRYDYSHPKRLAAVLDAFPSLTVIAAHFGGWSLFDLALEYLEHRSCYLDVSSSIMMTGKRRAKELIRAYGADRILFGTDFPMWSPKKEVAAFLSLGLSETENAQILHENVEKILQL